jgi:hypothetical protein
MHAIYHYASCHTCAIIYCILVKYTAYDQSSGRSTQRKYVNILNVFERLYFKIFFYLEIN